MVQKRKYRFSKFSHNVKFAWYIYPDIYKPTHGRSVLQMISLFIPGGDGTHLSSPALHAKDKKKGSPGPRICCSRLSEEMLRIEYLRGIFGSGYSFWTRIFVELKLCPRTQSQQLWGPCKRRSCASRHSAFCFGLLPRFKLWLLPGQTFSIPRFYMG
jgi:hypothetical protein